MGKNINRFFVALFCILMLGMMITFAFINTFAKSFNAVSEEEMLEHTLETTEQMNSSFDAFLDSAIRRIEMLKKTLGYIPYDQESEIMDYMSYICNDENIKNIKLVSENGDYIDCFGKSDIIDLSDEDFERMNQQEILYRYKNAGEKSLKIGVSIDRKYVSGKEMDYLMVEYKLDLFLGFLENSPYGGKGEVYVIDSNGNVIYQNGNDDGIPKTENLYNYIENAIFEYNDDITDIDSFMEKVKNADSSSVRVSINDNTYALSVVKANVLDWSLVLMVDRSVLADARDEYIQQMGYMSLATISVIVIICLIIYFCVTRLNEIKTDKMLSNRERLMNILCADTMGSYILVDSKTDTCSYVSPGTQEMLGISSADLVGEKFERVLEITSRNQKSQVLKEAMQEWQQEQTLDTERFSFIHPVTGQKKFLHCKCFVPCNGEMVVTIMDETKAAQQEQAIRDAMLAADSASRAKSEFLSNMSHDIRTPMNAIMGFTRLLEADADNPDKVKDYTEKIMTSSSHLLNLINNILDMSRIESGKLAVNIEEFSLSALLNELRVVVMPQIKAKQQEFNIHMYNLRYDKLLGDKLHVSQIIINLLSNAVKYTPSKGTIHLSVYGVKESADGYYLVKFEIKDNGIGMSQEFQEIMFEPFSREENSFTNRIKGTGLGMAIAKSLADLMCGNIYVESEENNGSTVVVELDFKIPEEEEFRMTEQEESAGTEVSLKGMKFLVAEDNEMNAEIMQELLAIENAKCDIAPNGVEVIKQFEASKPGYYDMILMDIRMPDMDGYDAARAIRSLGHPDAETIPIIAVTANAFADDVRNALAAGMNAHISKPMELEALRKTVEKLKK